MDKLQVFVRTQNVRNVGANNYSPEQEMGVM